MSRFQKICCGIVGIELALIVCANLFVVTKLHSDSGRLYRVEARRAAEQFRAGTAQHPDLSQYKTVVGIREIAQGEPVPTMSSCQNDFLLVAVGDALYCVEYRMESDSTVLAAMNIVLAGMFLVCAGVLWYIDRKVLTPFHKMQELSVELAKGNLSVPVKEEKSKFFGKFLWGMDMLRENLEEKKRRELDLQKEKKTLILSLSHDIKTPLSAIELYTKALTENLYDNPQKQQEALHGIARNVQEIKSYVSEIAVASREDFLGLEVRQGECYLAEVIERVQTYYSYKLSVLHTEFAVEPFENCLLKGDKDRLVEVLQNLMENAMKYGDGRQISISFADEEDCRLIQVENTGGGMSEEELPHLFDSFYRGSNAGNVKGSGLGLYICKELMKKMDGDIFAKCRKDGFAVTVVVRKV